MAKLQRYPQKIFGENSSQNDRYIVGYFAENGACSQAQDIGEAQSNNNFEDGLPAIVVGENSPVIGDINSLYWIMTYQLAYLLQHGVPEWNEETTYYLGSIVNYKGQLFRCVSDNDGAGLIGVGPDSLEWEDISSVNKKEIALNRMRGLSRLPVQENTKRCGDSMIRSDGLEIVAYGGVDYYSLNGPLGRSIYSSPFTLGEYFSSIACCPFNAFCYGVSDQGKIFSLNYGTDASVDSISGANPFIKIFNNIMFVESDDAIKAFELKSDGTASALSFSTTSFTSIQKIPRVTKISESLFVIIDQDSVTETTKKIRLFELSGGVLSQIKEQDMSSSDFTYLLGDNLSLETIAENTSKESDWGNSVILAVSDHDNLLICFDSSGDFKKTGLTPQWDTDTGLLGDQTGNCCVVYDRKTGLLSLMGLAFNSTFNTNTYQFFTCYLDPRETYLKMVEGDLLLRDFYFHSLFGSEETSQIFGRRSGFVREGSGQIEFCDRYFNFKTV